MILLLLFFNCTSYIFSNAPDFWVTMTVYLLLFALFTRDLGTAESCNFLHSVKSQTSGGKLWRADLPELPRCGTTGASREWGGPVTPPCNCTSLAGQGRAHSYPHVVALRVTQSAKPPRWSRSLQTDKIVLLAEVGVILQFWRLIAQLLGFFWVRTVKRWCNFFGKADLLWHHYCLLLCSCNRGTSCCHCTLPLMRSVDLWPVISYARKRKLLSQSSCCGSSGGGLLFDAVLVLLWGALKSPSCDITALGYIRFAGDAKLLSIKAGPRYFSGHCGKWRDSCRGCLFCVGINYRQAKMTLRSVHNEPNKSNVTYLHRTSLLVYSAPLFSGFFCYYHWWETRTAGRSSAAWRSWTLCPFSGAHDVRYSESRREVSHDPEQKNQQKRYTRALISVVVVLLGYWSISIHFISQPATFTVLVSKIKATWKKNHFLYVTVSS